MSPSAQFVDGHCTLADNLPALTASLACLPNILQTGVITFQVCIEDLLELDADDITARFDPCLLRNSLRAQLTQNSLTHGLVRASATCPHAKYQSSHLVAP